MIWEVFMILLVLWLCVRRWRLRKLVRLYNQVKSDLVSLPLLGHALYFIGDHEVHMSAFNRFGRESIDKGGLSAFWIGDYLFLILTDPELLDILFKVYLEKGEVMRFVKAVIGNGSLVAPVSIWKPRRKILVPTFSPKNLNNFVDIFARQSKTMVNKLTKAVGKGPFSLWPFMTTYSMDSVCESTLGLTVKAQENPNHPFLVAFDNGTQLISNRLVEPWTHNDVIYKLMPTYKKLMDVRKTFNGFIGGIIKSKREAMKRDINEIIDEQCQVDNGSLKTFLELLIDSSGKSRSYSDVELTEEILVLVMAGTDTSAVGASFTALMLANHPEVQEKVYQELQEIFGDSQRPVVADDLPRLKYLDAVIRESLRLYPPVPLVIRRTDKDFTLPNGLTIVKGCELMLSIWAIHRNPRYWGDDAEEFRPERFIDTPLKHPAQFVPFSYGPRNCVGYQYAMMSMKTALATLLRSYKILPDTSNTEATNTVPYASPETSQINGSKLYTNGLNTSKTEDSEPKLRNRLKVNATVENTKLPNGGSQPNETDVVGVKAKYLEENRTKNQNNKDENKELLAESKQSNDISKFDDKTNKTMASKTNGHSPKSLQVTKPLRVKFSIMMKDINNFTIQLEARQKALV